MFSRKQLMSVLGVIVVLSMVLAACGPTAAPPEVQTVVVEKTSIVEVTQEVVEQQTVVVEKTTIVEVTAVPPESTRTGAWVDQLVFTEQNDAQAAVKQLQADDADIYAYTVNDAQIFETVTADPGLAYTTAFGSYNEISANPVPTFIDGRINPFGVAKFREAMNMLVDRNYMVQEIIGGLGVPKVTSLNSAFPDYARYVDVCREIEAKYAYNPDKAKEIIGEVMAEMGATLEGGKWQYNGAPVTLIGIIRTEDERKEYGDYVSTQLEDAGFTVDRQYKTRSEASPIWNQSDPNEGQWNFYTGGWITTAISRDDATNFGYYYTDLGSGSPLWQNYKPSDEFKAVADRLWINDFKSMDERAELFKTALYLANEDSARIWLVDAISFAPQRADMEVAYDLAGGVAGSSLFPYTIRFKDAEGGTMRVIQPGVLVEPWNPIAGSNWIYDMTPIRSTRDRSFIADPYTGLFWPLRAESAACTVKTGLPVAKTLDWISLEFADKIEVPATAWADWDATTQTWIEAGKMTTPTLEANTKCTVTYPKDMWEKVKWHDGSPLTIADFMMYMILLFDKGKPESAIYDEALAPQVDALLSHFRGVTIDSTDPLVITTYDDTIYLDVEWLAAYSGEWWPDYAQGTGAWHNMAVGVTADAAGQLAFSTDKAGAKGIEWMSYIAGPSLELLKGDLDALAAKGSIVYTPTLGMYLTPEEIAARYANLTEWYKLQGHFWIGTGPFWLDKAFPVEKTVSLRRFEDYPDPADRWSGFGVPPIPVIEVTGPASVKVGAADATFEVMVSFNDAPYASTDIAGAKYLVFDATGALAGQGELTLAEEGKYTVTLPAETTGKLTAGSSKFEAVVVSNLVAIPGIVDYEFVVQ
jgi:peptide/nickel transport system substrate-binding protein